MMSGLPENQIFALNSVRLRLDADAHPWQTAEHKAIEAHWAREQVERPWLFNGTVILHRGLGFRDGVLEGVSHRVSYAALLHFIHVWPDADVWHLFGSAVILSSDNAMVLVRMGTQTANAGKVYAPSGSLDCSDIRDGMIDVEGCIRREALEEVGLDALAMRAEPQLLGWRRRGLIAVFRRFAAEETADQLLARMRMHIKHAPEQEVEDVLAVRSTDEAGPTTPAYMRALLEHHFSEAEPVFSKLG